MILITVLTFLYFLSGIATSRRVAYALETKQHNSDHSFKSICTNCYCKNCGFTHGEHNRYRIIAQGIPCDDFEYAYGPMHGDTAGAVFGTIMTGPAVAAVYGIRAASLKVGMIKPEFSFYKAPPVIETKEAKRERLISEREAAQAQRDKEFVEWEIKQAAVNKELEAREKELGIGEYRSIGN